MIVRGYTRASEDCRHVDHYFHGADKTAFAADLDYLVAVLPNTAGTRQRRRRRDAAARCRRTPWW